MSHRVSRMVFPSMMLSMTVPREHAYQLRATNSQDVLNVSHICSYMRQRSIDRTNA